jgi:hypothetical protein
VDGSSRLSTLRSETRRARRAAPGRAASSCGPRDHLGLHRQQALALQFLAGKLAGAADGLRLFPDSFFGGFLVVGAELHLTEHALALHFLLQHPEGLIDIVVTDKNLHVVSFSIERSIGATAIRLKVDFHNVSMPMGD